MSDNTTPSHPKPRYSIVNAAELKKIMRRFKYVFVTIDFQAYHRTGVAVDKRYVVDQLQSYTSKYDYMFEIDDNYEHTLYIERVIRTPKQSDTITA